MNFHCKECGSKNVEMRYWVNLNTEMLGNPILEGSDDYYCEDCDDYVEIVEIDDVDNTIANFNPNYEDKRLTKPDWMVEAINDGLLTEVGDAVLFSNGVMRRFSVNCEVDDE